MNAPRLARYLLANAIDTEEPAIPEDARIGLFERWDSLAHMRLLLAVEERLGRLLDPDEVAAIESLDDIDALLQNSRV
jgi:acyl carrier protein